MIYLNSASIPLFIRICHQLGGINVRLSPYKASLLTCTEPFLQVWYLNLQLENTCPDIEINI